MAEAVKAAGPLLRRSRQRANWNSQIVQIIRLVMQLVMKQVK